MTKPRDLMHMILKCNFHLQTKRLSVCLATESPLVLRPHKTSLRARCKKPLLYGGQRPKVGIAMSLYEK
jgi:hypothetical protein